MKLRNSVLALAVAGALGLSASPASAALGERNTDPVVTTGAAVPGLIGAAPGEIVAFSYDGSWKQIPVQVDERKIVDAQDLYPDSPRPSYVIGGIEVLLPVYADAKTRSGADTDPKLDADDEVVVMAKDAGQKVTSGKVAPPAGVKGTAGTELSVSDSIDGGSGFVYLFRSAGKLEPSAGKQYVNYDFKLTNLGPGQTLLENYGYANSKNPEDSTVTTPYYSLHSTDRWMEDRMQITAGGANNIDILDREVAQATLTSCGRTEITFSGNWNRGSDTDEGTYIAVKNGPVRAIRSFMGANSGPYTQRDHIYYEQREDNNVYLRVHPMLDLYTWTDYAESATGMTYRNFKNPAGVPVDGVPDTLVQPNTSEFEAGKVAWEQLVGPQGAVNTVTSVVTDLPEPNFGSYYLDDSTPTAPNEKQCGGDGKSFGASGFGILGPVTPNTDPVYPGYNSLTVKRTRYFEGPDSDAAAAARKAEQVRVPLVAAASAFTARAPKAKLSVKLPKKAAAKPGGKATVSVRVRNSGDAGVKLTLCAKGPKAKLGGLGCKSRGLLGAEGSRVYKLRFKLKPGAKKGQVLKVRFEAKAPKTATSRGTLKIRVK